MPVSILTTKLYIPSPRRKVVPRPRLMERLNQGLNRKLTLISAPAGFGKTTLVSEWCELQDKQGALPHSQIAWLSLDLGDNDPARFLTYLVAALQKAAAQSSLKFGQAVFSLLQSPQLPPLEPLLTTLLTDITAIPNDFVLVLDDYHVIEPPICALPSPKPPDFSTM